MIAGGSDKHDEIVLIVAIEHAQQPQNYNNIISLQVTFLINKYMLLVGSSIVH